MKHKVSIFAILMMVLTIPQSVKAYDFSNTSQGKTLYYNIVDGNAHVVSHESPINGELIIPSTVTHNGTTYSVTCIDSYSFLNCEELTSVSIPNSVTTIGELAFCGCIRLRSVNIPNEVASIGESAFSNVKHIEYHGTATGSPWEAYSMNGYYEDGIVYLDEIKDYLIAYIGNSSNVVIPSTVIEIRQYAFAYSDSLLSVTIPNSVQSIGVGAFEGCSNLASVNIPTSVTTLGGDAFNRCTGLTSIVIPGSINTIGAGAFLGSGLESVTISEGVTVIDGYAFEYCTNLTSVTIPSSVTNISFEAFNHDSSLTVVYFNATNATLSYYYGSNPVFHGCPNLTTVIFGNNVQSVPEYSFAGCRSINSVIFGSSIVSIEHHAFYNCSGITSITIPNGVTTIGNHSFSSCTGLSKVTIGRGVTTIGNSAFSECTNLDTIWMLPSSVPQVNTNITAYEDFTYNVFPKPVFMIPCGSYSSYYDAWTDIRYRNKLNEMSVNYTINVEPNNLARGTAYVVQQDGHNIACDSTVIVQAIPAEGYFFVCWSDGIIDNPYTFKATNNVSIIAVFSDEDITVHDTVTNTVYDTVDIYVHDTIFMHDTTLVTDTLLLTVHDTVWIIDTVHIFDTIVVGVNEVDAINAKIYTSHGQIVVEGSEDNHVWLYDVNGRVLATKQDEYSSMRFDVPASGSYLVRIGNHPARKVVVIK